MGRACQSKVMSRLIHSTAAAGSAGVGAGAAGGGAPATAKRQKLDHAEFTAASPRENVLSKARIVKIKQASPSVKLFDFIAEVRAINLPVAALSDAL